MATIVQDNPFTPGIQALQFNPDQLIAGNQQLVSNTVTFLSGQVLKRGTVLGRITASGKYVLALGASNDGSQIPVAIAADDVDASTGDVLGAIYNAGEFDSTSLTLGSGVTMDAAVASLRSLAIYIKTTSAAMSSADAT